MNEFVCEQCQKKVQTQGHIGTHQRNHCPYCLYSKHVDITPGDRNATCQGLMKPVALTFKKEGAGRIGEIMLVHQCLRCGKVSINRLAADDGVSVIMDVFEASLSLADDVRQALQAEGIAIATESDKKEIEIQLFGN